MPHPREGCTPKQKVTILRESGEHEGPHPREGYTPVSKVNILRESGEHESLIPVRVARQA